MAIEQHNSAEPNWSTYTPGPLVLGLAVSYRLYQRFRGQLSTVGIETDRQAIRGPPKANTGRM